MALSPPRPESRREEAVSEKPYTPKEINTLVHAVLGASKVFAAVEQFQRSEGEWANIYVTYAEESQRMIAAYTVLRSHGIKMSEINTQDTRTPDLSAVREKLEAIRDEVATGYLSYSLLTRLATEALTLLEAK